ncbi:MAG TPA: hypothetical protein VG754_11105 [Verrucomicrobiae bacterium]|nr:hypothetical protein [Verrucomicrobiae bacterium]
MKKVLFITFVFLAIAGMALVFLLRKPSGPPIPSYQGKSADVWLSEVFTTNQAQALSAFSEMGTNAWPFLVDVFRQRESSLNNFSSHVYPKLPWFFKKYVKRPILAEEKWNSAELVFLQHPHERDLTPTLLEMLRDKSNQAHGYVVGLLMRDAAGHGDWVPLLIPCLHEKQIATREETTMMLGQLGPDAKAAIPDLSAGLHDTNEMLRVESAFALWRIDHQTNGVAAIQNALLTSADVLMKRESAILLSQIGWTDPSLIPVYAKLVTDSDKALSVSAAIMLENFGTNAKSAVPSLVKAYELNPPYDRQYIWSALRAVDPNAAAKCKSGK